MPINVMRVAFAYVRCKYISSRWLAKKEKMNWKHLIYFEFILILIKNEHHLCLLGNVASINTSRKKTAYNHDCQEWELSFD